MELSFHFFIFSFVEQLFSATEGSQVTSFCSDEDGNERDERGGLQEHDLVMINDFDLFTGQEGRETENLGREDWD